jgi:hypothetical protein
MDLFALFFGIILIFIGICFWFSKNPKPYTRGSFLRVGDFGSQWYMGGKERAEQTKTAIEDWSTSKTGSSFFKISRIVVSIFTVAFGIIVTVLSFI